MLNAWLSNGDGEDISTYDQQYYAEHPEAIKNYKYASLLKCKFSDKTIDCLFKNFNNKKEEY